MDVTALLVDLFGRVDEHVEEVLEGLEPGDLVRTITPGSNPVGWLVWHSTRVLDAQIADVARTEQVWVTGDWGPRFGLPSDPSNHGYGHSAADVASVQPDGIDALSGYHGAVSAEARRYLAGLMPTELDRVVDEAWDPPVTLGVRLVSVADDDIQHLGQAAYLKGLLAAAPAER